MWTDGKPRVHARCLWHFRRLEPMPLCSACSQERPKLSFTKGQLKKGAGRRCTSCMAAVQKPEAGDAQSTTSSSKLFLHATAAKVVAGVGRGAGVRTLLYDDDWVPPKVRPVVTALVTEVLKALPRLTSALACVSGPWSESDDARLLSAVLMQDMIVREQRVKGSAGHPLARAIWEHRRALLDVFASEADTSAAGSAAGVSLQPASGANALSVSGKRTGSREAPLLPRYVRVNTLRTSVSDAIAVLQREVTQLKKAGGAGIDEDPMVPGLLRLPPKTSLHSSPMVQSGALVLQDRASCLPALALSPPAGATVIDACAAPGNKTTQLAALVGATGTVHAFERNAKRANTLREMSRRVGARNAIPRSHAPLCCRTALPLVPCPYPYPCPRASSHLEVGAVEIGPCACSRRAYHRDSPV